MEGGTLEERNDRTIRLIEGYQRSGIPEIYIQGIIDKCDEILDKISKSIHL